MKTGLSTACYYGDKEVEDTIRLYRSEGVNCMEVFLNCESEYDRKFIDELKAIKGECEIHSVHPHGTSFEPELFSVHGRTRADAEKTFRKICYACFVLGAKYITFHGPFRKVGRQIDVEYGEFGARVNQLCEIASTYGVFIAFENVNWAFGDKPEFFSELLPYCPELKTTLDVKQALYTGIDPLRYLEAMGDRVVTVHLCDLDRGDNPIMPFSGRYNFEKLIREISHRNISPALLLEVYRSNFRSDDELISCLNKLRNVVNSVK